MNESNMTDAELVSLSRPGIYAITHIASGKQYIGQSFNISHRWAQHRFDLRRNRHPTDHLQRAWNKYGADAFVFSVLEYVEPGDDLLERLYEREQHWIDARGSEVYNSRPAARSMLGYRHTPETCERMRAGHRGRLRTVAEKAASERRRGIPATPAMLKHLAKINGRPMNDAQRAALENGRRNRDVGERQRAALAKGRELLRGRPVSLETRARLSAAHKGRPTTDKQREAARMNAHKMHEANRGKPVSAETRAKISDANRSKGKAQTTTLRILAFLGEWPFDIHPTLLQADIAAGIGLSAATVCVHLRHLIAEGRIDRHY